MDTVNDELELQETLKENKKKEIHKRKLEIEEQKQHQIEERKANNTSVYISNIDVSGLGTDDKVFEVQEQLIKEFSKFGIIRKNTDGLRKCNMYRDENGKFKGDALIVYAKPESVPFAIEIMDGFEFKGKTLRVQKAVFEPLEQSISGCIDAKICHLTKKLKTNRQNSLSSDEKIGDKTVVLDNIIDIYADFDVDELDDIKEDIKEGCQQFGEIISYYLDQDKGKATLTFTLENSAQECQKYMDGRFFDGREVLAFIGSKENIEPKSEEGSDISEIKYEDIEDNGAIFIQNYS
ncbi:similar to Saccharomyces cerevisiae YNL286W CUS2 Protein that binds to U2 snRNA and Prp11p, may be involved in U2 snRNA folding [Maudiozyma barnettii]|uniref:Similar to Saccharomyces cerevisiae YNL286W CUS2 Protein that binds to U2 snRNA and Prp11p, may be involved in U2 snRNA folding n=1 Tax=Maudiozyma barnettii TaxID=61262 RepID=A0A8H2ZH62_9SACH|nr:U2 snRNP complex subunit CUS2 [Kazachstania barnettii]CAB4253574.1 similar to Saccharomyces cerevisiae YNL286W CUS2 Protein that binds to U2 snRNA and Prp11p, may be involved in U2 snRNA folding [Kazachstania barnettii]CAD1781248.1 similar to Saccharomyces cerevisiae YNL286W CUS2 Protein that binds to U2 snRNA and Prp11p, may be involved in U2 snRNA folding [Kazachstania barnettii]